MSVRVLFVEDSQDDVELQLRRLREAGMEPHWDRVQTEDGLKQALADESWQVALVDYNIPGFSGIGALRLIAELAPDLPAVTVSGAIDEDTAVATMSAGAVDYVLKDNLTRLAPAVRTAIGSADLRRAHREAAEAARLALFAVDNASLAVTMVAPDGTVVYLNDYACEMLLGDRGDLVGEMIWDLDHGLQRESWQETWSRAVAEGTIEFRVDRRQPDGDRLVLDVTANHLQAADVLVSYGRDITRRVAAEEALQAEQINLAAIFEASPVAMLVCDAGANVVRVNRAALRLAGRDEQRLLEHRPDSEVQCGDVLGCTHHFESADGCGTSPECPLCPLRNAVTAVLEAAVSVRGVEVSMEVLRDDEPEEVWLRIGAEPMVMDGAPHVTVAVDDITDRRRAELALRESEQRFELFAEHFPGYFFMHNAELRCVYTNRPEAADGVGTRADWLGKRPTEVWSGAFAVAAEDRLRRVLTEGQLDVIVPWEGKGEVEHLHTVYFRIPRGERPPLIGGLSIDVTQQVEAQEEVRRQAEQLRRTVEGAVLAMSQVVETRDPYTAGHERRVAELATVIGRDIGLNAAELDGLRLGALIHDIGKIAVPAEILAKPGRLSTVEFNLIKQHPRSGYDILSVIDFGRPVAEMVLQHHERLDGSGYPQGLTTEDLLPETRILAVADVVEAMSSHRPYRAALGREAALAEIRDGAGTRYDPDVVAACERVMVEGGFHFSP